MRRKFLLVFNFIKNKLTIEYLLIISCIPFVLIVRVLKPIIHIRFGIIHTSGLGDLISGCWDYEAKKFLKIHPKHAFDLFFVENNNKFICNNYLYKYFINFGNYKQSHFIYYLWRANLLFKDFSKFDCVQINYFEWPARKAPILFSVNSKEKDFFKKELSSQAKINTDFVCFHSRDSDYKRKITPHLNQSLEEVSHQDYRNSKFADYNKSSIFLSKKGLKSIRIGKIANSTISNSFWDYSNSTLRDDKNDVLICSLCKFWVMTTSGVAWIPQMLGKAGVAVNLIPFTPELLWHYPKGTVVLPKTILNKKGIPVPLEEITTQQTVNHDEKKFIDKYFIREGLSFKDNSENEIFEAVKDYYESQIIKSKNIELEIQYKFWKKLYPKLALDLTDRIIISPSYLRSNALMFK